ncbi:MAG: type II toxin-antitoxin system RelE/ParE family toxin [Deferribacteraceae bacterium]|jgi:mRNA interferase RelE/StbE|nr:type II toxin-antitoxin system RelE/ParE family toxin [Deferribacteraceae bacterium]
MKWSLKFSKNADKQLSKMDNGVRRIIISWLMKNINECDNPRVHGKGLTSNHSGEWCYRIGNYRVLCDIHENDLVVLAFSIEHRSEVYKD